jgi:hypothetical protein
VIGAASRDQARIAFKLAERFLAHPALEGLVTQRHLEFRFRAPEGLRRLRVIPSDGPQAHGLSCTLYIGDGLGMGAEHRFHRRPGRRGRHLAKGRRAAGSSLEQHSAAPLSRRRLQGGRATTTSLALTAQSGGADVG